MDYEEILEHLNEDKIKRGHKEDFEPEFDVYDDKIIDAGEMETEEEREANND